MNTDDRSFEATAIFALLMLELSTSTKEFSPPETPLSPELVIEQAFISTALPDKSIQSLPVINKRGASKLCPELKSESNPSAVGVLDRRIGKSKIGLNEV